MEVIYLLLPLVIVLIAGAAWLFLRALRSGQFDDLETPAVRILFDDEKEPKK